MGTHPLVVDLDGTLIRTDMLHELALATLRVNPLETLRIPFWLSRGKAFLKHKLSECVPFEPKSLPYNTELLGWLRTQKDAGRRLVLCTAADTAVAATIATHLGLFDEVIGSDGTVNLAGKVKADALEQRFGRTGFDYAGNSSADLAVWERARRGVVVNASRSVARLAGKLCQVEQVFPPAPAGLRTWGRALRMHQWVKNLLLFIPMLAAHELTSGSTWASVLLAFVSFSLCASAVYIANDLFDLESDRDHPRKRLRPFASGELAAWLGVAAAPLLVLASVVLGLRVGGSFLGWLGFYFALTCAYTWGLKRVVLVDCLALAMLYTLRIVAGAAAASHASSFWLLAFSVFLFLSLAFVKRYAELAERSVSGEEKLSGRGYYTSDAPLIQTLGVTSGYASVLVLALYLNSDAVIRLYASPEVMWGAVPVLLFWVSWIWMQAHRGRMHDDPVIFAIKDRASLMAGAAFAIVLALGATGFGW